MHKREAARLEGTGGPLGVGHWKGGVNPSLTPSSGPRGRFLPPGRGVRAVTAAGSPGWADKALKNLVNPRPSTPPASAPTAPARLRFPQPAK